MYCILSCYINKREGGWHETIGVDYYPVYNKEKWIVQTLQSVASQTYENWECFIVDDGSTDNSLQLINSFTKTAKGIGKYL